VPVGRAFSARNIRGAQSGLGYIIVFSQQFAYLDRMFFVALLIVPYALISYAIIIADPRRTRLLAPKSGSHRTSPWRERDSISRSL
jgi:ABC-type nitrate/sulfonate/bicarbonate transport system permease component